MAKLGVILSVIALGLAAKDGSRVALGIIIALILGVLWIVS